MNDRELRAAVYQAFELRGSPYYRDALEWIVDRFERKPLTEVELQMERDARVAKLIRLLRDTDPARITAPALRQAA